MASKRATTKTRTARPKAAAREQRSIRTRAVPEPPDPGPPAPRPLQEPQADEAVEPDTAQRSPASASPSLPPFKIAGIGASAGGPEALQQAHAIGVALSGTGSDGTLGVREIKTAAGIAIAQSPESARYDGRPRAAIATGAVDLVLEPAAIAHQRQCLAKPIAGEGATSRDDSRELHVSERDLASLYPFLRGATAVDFTQYKAPTIRRRLQRRMLLHRIHRLSDDLRLLRQQPDEVQKLSQDLLIQDLEAASEELQSANEEILSSNEKLQSTNEELDTAREELQARNEELSRARSDMSHCLASAEIAIVGPNLRIRRFTPTAERVLNLIAADVGRPIGHIQPNIDCPGLEQRILDVAESMAPYGCQVRDRQGNGYSLRIRPYKNPDHRIEGAVLALFDIDSSVRDAQQLEEQRALLGSLLQLPADPLLILDQNLRVTHLNRSFSETFRIGAEEADGESLFAIAGGRWDVPELRALLFEQLRSGTRAAAQIELSLPGDRQQLCVSVRRTSGPDLAHYSIVVQVTASDEST